MPLYEYRCTQCGHRVELIQKVADPPPPGCEKCGGAVSKVLSAPALQFKGTGFYITDYPKKEKEGEKKKRESGESKEPKSDQKSESKPDSKPAESKPASAPATESKSEPKKKTES